MSYMDRALKAKNPRYARILEKLGYERRDMVAVHPLDHDGDGFKGASKPEMNDDLKDLRAEYEAVIGKRPFMGWDAAKLREKIAEAKA